MSGSDHLVQVANSFVGQSPNEWRTKEVAGGRLACAKAVTHILRAAGLIDWSEINVDKTRERLKAEGWMSTQQQVIGSVVVWDKNKKYSNKHIGIVTEPNMSVQNSSEHAMAVKRLISERPVIEYLVPPHVEPENNNPKHTVFFTSYNPEVGQTDSTPCVGASGKDQCQLAKEGVRMLALSQDLVGRVDWKPYTYGDRVLLKGETDDPRCNGEFEVVDTMNKRYTMRGDLFFMNRSDNTSCTATVQKI